MQVPESEFEEESLEQQVEDGQKFKSINDKVKAANRRKLLALLIVFLMIGGLLIFSVHYFRGFALVDHQIEEQRTLEASKTQNQEENSLEKQSDPNSINSEKQKDLDSQNDFKQSEEQQQPQNLISTEGSSNFTSSGSDNSQIEVQENKIQTENEQKQESEQGKESEQEKEPQESEEQLQNLQEDKVQQKQSSREKEQAKMKEEERAQDEETRKEKVRIWQEAHKQEETRQEKAQKQQEIHKENIRKQEDAQKQEEARKEQMAKTQKQINLPPKKPAQILSLLKNSLYPITYVFGTDRQKQLPVCAIYIEGTSKLQLEQSLGYPLSVVEVEQQKLFLEPNRINLHYLNEKIDQKCVRNSIIFFLNKEPSLRYLNQLSTLYQTRKVWATYVKTGDSLKIVSIYQRLLLLAEHNYLTGSQLTTPVLDNRDLTLDLLQMSLDNIQQRTSKQFDFNHESFLNVSLSWQYINDNRPKYDSLLSMKQFSKIDKNQNSKNMAKLLQNKDEGYVAKYRGLTQQMMEESIQLRELVYLPVNHSLQSRQRKIRDSVYHMSEYPTEKPLCVFIPSHNNMQDNRYQRVIDSILQQEYSNYHIVFVDDYSDDGTLINTMRYLDKLGFPQDRVTYIQNLQKNYATYNIVNGAFNYCKADDIMVLVDGDDQLVGRQVFKLVNSGYQRKPVWVLWTTFTSNIYTYGSSRPLKSIDGYLNKQRRRKADHWIGHLTTFYAGFFRYIKIEAHQCLPGVWLDTLYDDAMQHPLIEMATIDHLQYIREMTYLYNKNYGNNDDSSQWKKIYRKSLYFNKVAIQQPYQPLQYLDFSYRNQVIEEQLSRDRNVRFKDIQLEEDIVNITDNIQMNKDGPCQKYIREIVANKTAN